MIKVKILFGQEECYKYEVEQVSLSNFYNSVQVFNFNSLVEKESFLKGLEVGMGWERFVVVN
ncbi:hypothetical protein [Fulvivirga sp.]|jgi:hypothetical protein|uniref:hypothetical protein n=1 Tax=Fulvivirga sp. TaxID=1931237 RepID=UPI0032EBA1A9